MEEPKKKKNQETAKTPAWVPLFTSLMIILLTFFILLNNYAEMDEHRVRRVLTSIHETFGFFPKGKQSLPLVGSIDSNIVATIEKEKKEPEKGDEDEDGDGDGEGAGGKGREELVAAIQEMMDEKDLEGIEIKVKWQEVVVTLKDQIFFDSGSDRIHPAVISVIEDLGDLVMEFPYRIEIRGHADSRPIRSGRFRSNWELSVARAMSVLKVLAEKKMIPPERLQAAGFGEYSPVATNATELGRAANRRVEIVFLLPEENEEADPTASEGI